jgi:hypothetical protein
MYWELWRPVPPRDVEFIAVVEAPDFNKACQIHSMKVGHHMARSIAGVWSYRGEVVYPSKREAKAGLRTGLQQDEQVSARSVG